MNKILVWIVRIALLVGLFFLIRWVITLNGLIAFMVGLFVGSLATLIILTKYNPQANMTMESFTKLVTKK